MEKEEGRFFRDDGVDSESSKTLIGGWAVDQGSKGMDLIRAKLDISSQTIMNSETISSYSMESRYCFHYVSYWVVWSAKVAISNQFWNGEIIMDSWELQGNLHPITTFYTEIERFQVRACDTGTALPSRYSSCYSAIASISGVSDPRWAVNRCVIGCSAGLHDRHSHTQKKKAPTYVHTQP